MSKLDGGPAAPLGAEVLPPRWPEFEDGHVGTVYTDLETNLVTMFRRHPSLDPSANSGQI